MPEHAKGRYRLEDSAGTVFVYSPRKAEPYQFTEQEACHRLVTYTDLLAACERAVALYELVISDHPDLDPDRELPPELGALRAAVARARGG
jgi:hypothetical protein